MGLRHLHADGAAADDDEMLGQRGVVEDGFVGEAGRGVEAGNGRHAGARACGDNEAAGAHFHVVDDDGVAILEARLALHDVDAETFEAGDAVIWRNGGDDAFHVRVDGGEIDLRRDGRNAEARAVGHVIGVLGGGDQRL